MQEPLGSLSSYPITKIWPDEARDFTPWLANLADLLGRTLGIDLEPAESEVSVGKFRADLMFRDAATRKPVIVENMYNTTDHDHLGKLLTYVAGLDGSCAVLIAEKFRPEHLSALNWLNSISDEEIAFFGIELEVWKIGASAPAPHLNLVVKPDSWSREVKSSADGLSTLRSTYREWWAEFLPEFQKRYPGWSNAKIPQAQGWMSFPSGKSGLSYAVVFGGGTGSSASKLRAELYIDTSNASKNYMTFMQLRSKEAFLAAEVGLNLDWQELEGRKACRIATYYDKDVNARNQADWPAYRDWALGALGKLRTAFMPEIQNLHDVEEVDPLSDE